MKPKTLLWIVQFIFIFVFCLRLQSSSLRGNPVALNRQQGIHQQVRSLIMSRHVEDVKEQDLFYASIKGMARSLDEHSNFWTPKEFERQQVETSGKFAGLGVEIRNDEELGLIVVTPLPNTPAYRAGLRKHDRIVAIDGHPTKDMTTDDAVGMIRGEEGTTLRLTIERSTEKLPFDVEVTRAIIKLPSIPEAFLLTPAQSANARIPEAMPRIGYVWLKVFQEDSADELKRTLERLDREGMEALILDLRQNPGGLLTTAEKVCDLFIDKGVIVSTRGRADSKSPMPPDYFYASANGTRPYQPMAILIDDRSASASEIVAGCMKDHRRATLIGQKTYGKGSVQSILTVDMGAWGVGALKLTTAKYYTPSGICIEKSGIEPDIEVLFDEQQSKAFLNARDERRILASGGKLEPENKREPAELFFDLQLEAAIQTLKQKLLGAE